MKVFIGLGVLQAFVGLGALGGGIMLVRDPSGSAMGLPMRILEGSPFPDFLIPGLFLLVVNGIGNMIGAVLSFTNRRSAPELAIILGAILVVWIVIQVVIIISIHWLHVIYITLGVIELGIGLYIRHRRFKAA